MPITLNGSTSGQVTIDAPAVAGTTSITLPAYNGTILAPSSAGTSGQLLTSAGSGVSPTWVSPTGAVFIGAGGNDGSTTTSFTNISTYSTIIVISSFASTRTATNSLRVAISSNNGTSYGANKIINNLPAVTAGAFGFSSGVTLITGVGVVGTKTITPATVGAYAGSTSFYGTVTTDAVTTGVTNALQFSGSDAQGSYSVSIWGVP